MKTTFKQTVILLITLFTALNLFAASVSLSEGNNQVKRADGEWEKLDTWDKVNTGDSIKTGLLGKVHVKFDGNIIKISPNTVMLFKNLEAGEEPIVAEVSKGFVWSNIKSLRKNTGFEVKTPAAIAGIRGTKFGVGEDDGKALFCVCEGEVNVQCKDQTYTLTTGDGIDTVEGLLAKKSDHAAVMDNGRALPAFKKMAMQKPIYQNCMECHTRLKKEFKFEDL